MFFRKKEKDVTGQKMGGLSFYLALTALAIIASVNLLNIWPVLALGSSERWLAFLFGIATGAALYSLLLEGSTHVFIHELKHAVLAALVGNRIKDMKFDSQTGHLRYSFSKRTAHFNAMIALAPYWLPLFTVPALLLLFTPYREAWSSLLVFGIAYGIDLITGARDIGRHQTDLTLIRGGFWFALIYILSWHTIILTYLLAWVCNGTAGVWHLAMALWEQVIWWVMQAN